MIKNLWTKIKSYQLSRAGKLVVGFAAIILLIIIVGWAA
jgi:hypothetical protein